MFAFKRWVPRVAGVVCCALIGAVWVPGVARASAASNKWAVVTFKGKLVRSHGATGAVRMSKGRYLVSFDTNMSKCAFVATPGDAGAAGFEFPVVATVGQPAGKPKAVFVQTFSAIQPNVTLADSSFHLTTYCGTSAAYAVINSDGSKARASHLVSSTRSGDGTYALEFDRDVHACAFTATIGSGIAGEVLGSGEITVDARAGDPNGVSVQTLVRSGVDTDMPFHVAVNCDPGNVIAVVNADGSTAIGDHVVSSAKFVGDTPGLYQVIFDRNVTNCSYTATVRAPITVATVDAPVTVTTASLHGNVNGVFLSTNDAAQGSEDEPFHLTVTC